MVLFYGNRDGVYPEFLLSGLIFLNRCFGILLTMHFEASLSLKTGQTCIVSVIYKILLSFSNTC